MIGFHFVYNCDTYIFLSNRDFPAFHCPIEFTDGMEKILAPLKKSLYCIPRIIYMYYIVCSFHPPVQRSEFMEIDGTI